MRNYEDKDCKACFMKDCRCECKTCVDAREKNKNKSNMDLLGNSIIHVVTGEYIK